jgi:hypothetical protein
VGAGGVGGAAGATPAALPAGISSGTAPEIASAVGPTSAAGMPAGSMAPTAVPSSVSGGAGGVMPTQTSNLGYLGAVPEMGVAEGTVVTATGPSEGIGGALGGQTIGQVTPGATQATPAGSASLFGTEGLGTAAAGTPGVQTPLGGGDIVTALRAGNTGYQAYETATPEEQTPAAPPPVITSEGSKSTPEGRAALWNLQGQPTPAGQQAAAGLSVQDRVRLLLANQQRGGGIVGA